MGPKDLPPRAKEMILNLRSYFEEEKKTIKSHEMYQRFKNQLPKNFNNVIERVCDALKVCRTTVLKVCKERNLADSTTFTPKSKKSNSGRKRIVLDGFDEGVVRRTVVSFYEKNEYPTVKKVHSRLIQDINFPRMTAKSLYNVMKRQLKFKFIKYHGKPIPLERNDIAASRCKYLQLVKFYRKIGYEIFYQDESFVNANISLPKGWHLPEKEVMSPNQTSCVDKWLKGVGHRFADKMIGGFSTKPSGAGKRLILNYIGSVNGFLPNVGETFEGNKKSKIDYHKAMNSDHFEKWLKTIIREIPNKSVIVLDQATYHKRVIEETKNPTTAWRKQNIIDWLIKNRIPIPHGITSYEKMTIPLLLKLAKDNRIQQKYAVEEMIKTSDKDLILLWLPVAHCELNPIELIWAQVKRTIAKDNNTFKIKDVEALTKKVLDTVTPEVWSKCIDHVITLEDLLIEKENIQEIFMENVPRRFIISVPNSDSDSNEDEDSWMDLENDEYEDSCMELDNNIEGEDEVMESD